MGKRNRYRKKADQFLIAIQLDLDIDGFSYRKWGAVQRCNRGDWLVDNNGEIYTVNKDVFERTYYSVGSGKYIKKSPVWAEVATQSGSVQTKEGKSYYKAGDYLVYNNEDGSDAYCVSVDKFESMYELDK